MCDTAAVTHLTAAAGETGAAERYQCLSTSQWLCFQQCPLAIQHPYSLLVLAQTLAAVVLVARSCNTWLQVGAYVPESALYTQLQGYEKQIDACISQRQAQVQDAVRRPLHVAKKLRIYIYNTHTGQESATPPSGQAAHYTCPWCSCFGLEGL